jgi:hypothetical protein
MRVPPEQRRELFAAIAAACLLIFARNFVYLVYEQSFFDSDQAIVGLMAKHLIEGRAFPLFLYGQPYLLALDAWIAAPFIYFGGLTVQALRLSAIFTSCVVVSLLIVTLVRFCRIRPLYALAAAAFFAFAGPVVNASLIEPGANTSPFLFVIVLWLLRERPVWFGLTLGFAFLTREFTIYTLPALAAVQLIRGELFTWTRIRRWAVALVAALAMWLVIDKGIRPLSDPRGPGTRGEPTWAGGQVGNLTDRIAIIPSQLPRRARAMLTVHFPRLLGAHYVDEGYASQGHNWLFWPLMLALVAGLARIGFMSRGRPPESRTTDFAIYLLLVGLTALAGYIATRPAEQSMDRYYLFGLLVPGGIVAWLLTVEPKTIWRSVTVGAVAFWIVCTGADYVKLLNRYWGKNEPNAIRELSDALIARNITVAKAGYWRAYKTTFISGERVKIASSDYVRIEEYQKLADAQGDALVTIQEKPCPAAGEHIGRWYLCRSK